MSSEIYLLFTDDNKHWISKFLHPQINHVEAVVVDGKSIISYAKRYDSVQLLSIKDIGDIISEGYLFKVKPKDKSNGLFMLNTCVGHVKQLLGIRKPFIWTPWQLFKYLRASNEQQT